MKHYLIIGILVCVLVLAGCSEKELPAQAKGDERSSVKSAVSDTKPAGEVKEFSITAKQWEFDPAVIEISKGDTVKLKIKSIDVTHGFKLPEFSISETLEPNKEVNVEFLADKTGEFDFFCHIPCGSGHRSMNGKLIVNG